MVRENNSYKQWQHLLRTERSERGPAQQKRASELCYEILRLTSPFGLHFICHFLREAHCKTLYVISNRSQFLEAIFKETGTAETQQSGEQNLPEHFDYDDTRVEN